MSKDLLQKVIDNGVEKNLNIFFQDATNHYAEMEDNLSEYDGNGFSDFRSIGEMDFGPAEKLVVVTVNVDGDLTQLSGKKAQYEIARKILKQYMRYDAGIFVFCDKSGSFRMSLVYGTPDAARLLWSNFRRFTYLVSQNLTNKTFLDRVGNCKFSSLESIKDSFSVEKVTKDFYRQIADWYFWAVHNTEFPKDAEDELNGRNNAVIRLITRLIFIWFMKERKLVSPDFFNRDKVQALLKGLNPEETTYYKAILQNLFFATLNTKMDKREFRFTKSYHGKNEFYMNHGVYRYENYFMNQQDMLVIFKDIPFLNGGLFDCLDWPAKESGTGAEVRFDGFSDKEIGLKVPNYLFFSSEREADLNADYGTNNKKYCVQGLLNILSAYNFTIDENDPNDSEVALDPELLGKVFENLLASFNPETSTTARKATGSYYTPREIVDYMVTQSLRQYYRTRLVDVPDVENKLDELLSPITGEPKNPFGEADSRKVVKLTEELRIVDPAVGSGAFPMGILNKLVSVLARVDHNNKLWQEAQLRAVDGVTDQPLKQKLIAQINESFSKKSFNYGRKLYLIEKCIYGVDIQPIAIEIAKLRFFIALLVDETIDKLNPDNWGIVPLPNLDFKLMQGNSLISEFVGIDIDANDSASPARLMKDEAYELIAQFQNQKGKFQSASDRDEKKKLKDEIEELIIRIFESKIQTQKKEYFNQLKNIERKYSGVPNIQQRSEAIKRETESLNKVFKFDLAQAETQLKAFTNGQKVKPFFAWKLYFAEVFKEKGGFDIVIANPPYIRQEQIKELKQQLQKQYKCYTSTADIYVYFYERGKQILNDNGTLAYISSNKYFRSGYGEGLRRLLCENCRISQIIDFGDAPVFEAIAYPSIIILKNIRPSENEVNVFTWQPGPNLAEFASVVRTGSYRMPQKELTSDGWRLESPLALRLLEKLRRAGKPLGDYVNGRFYRGILTGLNEAFVVDRATRDRLIADHPSSNEVLKPFLRGKDVKRWAVSFAEQYLIKFESSENKHHPWSGKSAIEAEKLFAQTYPAVYKRFVAYRDELKERQDQGTYYWELRSCKYWREFEGTKIIYPDIAQNSEFAFDESGYYLANTLYLMPTDRLWLLGLLNSSTVFWFYTKISTQIRGGFVRFIAQYVSQIPIPESGQTAIIETLVKQILNAKSKDPEADISDLEHQINQLVYQLYDLTPGEIALVEGKK